MSDMSKLIPLIATKDLPEGSSVECVAEGRIFAAYQVDGQYYVIDGICHHAGGPLGKGVVNGQVVTCPWHGWQFDVETGAHCLNQRLYQQTFETEVIDDVLNVRLEVSTPEATDASS